MSLEIRNKIKELIETEITLEEDAHKYILASDKKKVFKNCTDIVDENFEPFNKKRIAKKLVRRFPKYRHYTVKGLIAEWDASRDRGTLIHTELQRYIENGEEPTTERGHFGVAWFVDAINLDGVESFCEVIVFDEDLGIAGTVDLLTYNSKSGECNIYDWKTSKVIDREGYRGKTGITNATYDLQDCRFIKYSLQTTLYKYMLEKSFDIPIEGMYLIHLDAFSADLISAQHLRTHVKQIISTL